jgi:hypothetical protein
MREALEGKPKKNDGTNPGSCTTHERKKVSES